MSSPCHTLLSIPSLFVCLFPLLLPRLIYPSAVHMRSSDFNSWITDGAISHVFLPPPNYFSLVQTTRTRDLAFAPTKLARKIQKDHTLSSVHEPQETKNQGWLLLYLWLYFWIWQPKSMVGANFNRLGWSIEIAALVISFSPSCSSPPRPHSLPRFPPPSCSLPPLFSYFSSLFSLITPSSHPFIPPLEDSPAKADFCTKPYRFPAVFTFGICVWQMWFPLTPSPTKEQASGGKEWYKPFCAFSLPPSSPLYLLFVVLLTLSRGNDEIDIESDVGVDVRGSNFMYMCPLWLSCKYTELDHYKGTLLLLLFMAILFLFIILDGCCDVRSYDRCNVYDIH